MSEVALFSYPDFPHPEGFRCQQCGRCCQEYVGGRIQATENDMWRWTLEERDDIYATKTFTSVELTIPSRKPAKDFQCLWNRQKR